MSEIESPCRKICQLDEAKTMCVGCYRTLEEIAGWTTFSAEQKQTVLQDCGTRRTELNRPN